ncbi:54S ribosomal protein img2 like [Verticillium longisporum]|uniref:Large ribosomal subunit protein mL49 n=1 Tax=Verticillium longisporum TaxID=100787 RepID=A0A0G4NBS8_VERLO|nr:54S ribosomal protein img2 like [Verticillium longisporum]CRK44101.1 hypothetical protein BN1723_006018 [Verticillium longisporum]
MSAFIARALRARSPVISPSRSVFFVRFVTTVHESSTSIAVETTIPPSKPMTGSTIVRNATESAKPSERAYLVDLTPSKNYPVYPRTKSAGQSKFTVIKRIAGDKRSFAQDLANATGLPREDITISPVTNHVQIKGLHVTEVKKWLADEFGDPHKPTTIVEVSSP